jgi:molybdopterin/thiamine biosynthesis adenylyltransferase
MHRYLQQIAVPEMGVVGQQKLLSAKVLVVGAGGLGVPLATYLTSAGVGSLGVLDGDKVEKTNLHRQFLYTENDIDLPKANVLVNKLREQNISIDIHAHTIMLDNKNAYTYLADYDIICDCTDNALTRILCNNICRQLKKPLVYAVVKNWEGYVTVLHHQNKVSLEDFFTLESMMDKTLENCAMGGIINTTCGIAASIQATEVIKIILGLNSKLDGGILTFNALMPSFKIFNLHSSFGEIFY